MSSSLYTIKKFKIHTLTPVFIGSGEEFTPFTYIYDEENKSVYYLKEEMFEEIYKRCGNELLEQAKRGRIEMTEFLRQHNDLLSKSKQRENYYYKLSYKEIPRDKIHTFIKQYNEKYNEPGPYIPGSEIKGAIRTALLYSILKSGEKLPSNERELEKLLRINNTPQDDILRCLIIRDTNPVKLDRLIVEPVTVLHRRKNKRFRIWCEILQENTEFECEILIDEKLRQKFTERNKELAEILTFDGLKAKCKEFYKDLIDFEKQTFSEFSRGEVIDHGVVEEKLNEGKFMLRIGMGQGYYGLTVNLINRNKDIETKRAVRKDERKYLPLGWILLEEIR